MQKQEGKFQLLQMTKLEKKRLYFKNREVKKTTLEEKKDERLTELANQTKPRQLVKNLRT